MAVQTHVPAINVAKWRIAQGWAGDGVGNPTGAIFQQRQQQAWINRVILGNKLNDLSGIQGFAIYILSVICQIAALCSYKSCNVERSAQRSIYQFGVRYQLVCRAWSLGSHHRDGQCLANFEIIGVGNIVGLDNCIHADAVVFGNGTEHITRLDDVSLRSTTRTRLVMRGIRGRCQNRCTSRTRCREGIR